MAKKVLGERLLTDQFNQNTSEHLHRYAIASVLVRGKKVLDIACGEGYGSNLMAQSASSVTGVDIDAETVGLAQKKYKAPNLSYMTGSADNIPLPDASVEVVVSFETIEHLTQHDKMLAEIRRVLVPGGICIISTPDKLIYSDQRNYSNPFHVKELYKDEFDALLKKYFKNTKLFKQQFVSGTLFIPENEAAGALQILGGDFTKIEQAHQFSAEYLVAIASDQEIKFSNTSFFVDYNFPAANILQFQRSSLRYKIGNLLLAPIKFLKGGK